MLQILLQHVQIRHINALFSGEKVVRGKFVEAEALATSRLGPVPKFLQSGERQIVEYVPMGVIEQKESDPFLLLETFHKLHLVGMDILQAERILRAFFRIEADGNPLYRPDIIHSALLIEIGRVIWRLSLSICTGVMGVGIFWIRANLCSLYFSLVWLIRSSSVEPRRPLELQVAMVSLPRCHFCLLRSQYPLERPGQRRRQDQAAELRPG